MTYFLVDMIEYDRHEVEVKTAQGVFRGLLTLELEPKRLPNYTKVGEREIAMATIQGLNNRKCPELCKYHDKWKGTV